MFLILKSTVVTSVPFSNLNSPSTNLQKRAVLPTLLSPTSMNLYFFSSPKERYLYSIWYNNKGHCSWQETKKEPIEIKWFSGKFLPLTWKKLSLTPDTLHRTAEADFLVSSTPFKVFSLALATVILYTWLKLISHIHYLIGEEVIHLSFQEE